MTGLGRMGQLNPQCTQYTYKLGLLQVFSFNHQIHLLHGTMSSKKTSKLFTLNDDIQHPISNLPGAVPTNHLAVALFEKLAVDKLFANVLISSYGKQILAYNIYIYIYS